MQMILPRHLIMQPPIKLFVAGIISFIILIIARIFGLPWQDTVSWRPSSKRTFLIVGAGIAGATLAYRLRRRFGADAEIVIAEKTLRAGGRALQANFHGTIVKFGAGIIRKGDTALRQICGDLGISLGSFQATVAKKFTTAARFSEAEKNRAIARIIAAYRPEQHSAMTFVEYCAAIGESPQDIIANMGYGDMVNANVADTFWGYPLTDMFGDLATTKYFISGERKIGGKKWSSWDILTHSLINAAGASVIYGVDFQGADRIIGSSGKTQWRTKYTEPATIIIAVDKSFYERDSYSSVDSSVAAGIAKINSAVGSHSFLRGYSYREVLMPTAQTASAPVDTIFKPVARGFTGHLAGMTLCDAPILRIIPFSPTVCMSVYTDGPSADELFAQFTAAPAATRTLIDNYLNRIVMAPPDLQPYSADFVYKYWRHGIHYWRPDSTFTPASRDEYLKQRAARIAELMHIDRGFYACGEILSISQGWVEGAIESANRVARLIE